MKLFLIPFFTFLTALGLVHVSTAKKESIPTPAVNKITSIVRCNPGWTLLSEYIEETDIPPMPGAGKYKWDVHTKSDSAQFYFNQGINMYYGFHIIESMVSFIKAAKFDASNPMIWWARALAYGPNINDAGYTASPLAVAAIKKARELV